MEKELSEKTKSLEKHFRLSEREEGYLHEQLEERMLNKYYTMS